MNKIFSFFIIAVFIIYSSIANADVITDIRIIGNQRVESSTILEYLKIKKGDLYNAEVKSNAVKRLYASSLFEDINIENQNGIINVKVKENAFISKIVFSGNSKIKTQILQNEVYTAAGESLKKTKLVSDVEKIKEIYKRSGRFAAQVEAKIEPQENNRVKIIFNISEGPKTGIKQIYFAGNNNYKDSELKTVIMTKESRFFRFLETNDTYDPDRIEYDKYLLKEFYNTVGFADFRIISVTADLLPTKEGFILTYSIDEGDKFKFGEINLVNLIQGIEDKQIRKLIPNLKNKTFNSKLLQNSIEKINEFLVTNGFPQVSATPELKPNYNNNLVDVNIKIERAGRVYVNKINIRGNVKTEQHVIRREVKLAEGDILNRAKIAKGERNIRNLDYFSKLSIYPSPTAKVDRHDLNIDVEEKSTSSIGFDVGYNSSGGIFGRVSFLERNFAGTGKYISAGVQIGKKNLHYYFGITEPYFMDKKLLIGANFFNTKNGAGSGFGNGEQPYSQTSTGGKLNMSYDIMDDLTHNISYLAKVDKLTLMGNSKGKNSNSTFIKEQLGEYTTSAIGHSITLDKIDSRIIPKNGYEIELSQEYAGLGGNNKYLKHEIETKYFKSFFNNKYTLKLSGSVGNIIGAGGKKVRISDRFNLGEYSLRGFASGGIGPRDKATAESLGGQKYYSISSELNFPVGLPEEFNVQGAVFLDAGSVWDADTSLKKSQYHNVKSLRASYGFGIIWITSLAPFRFDWGFPIKKEKFDETQKFHMKFSAHF